MAKLKKEIVDFGEKIDGARKDIWRRRGLQESDLALFDQTSWAELAKRDYVWPLPDAKKLVMGGMSAFVAFWLREVRKMLSAVPVNKTGNPEQDIKSYVRAATELKTMAESVKTEADITEFYAGVKKHMHGYRFSGDWDRNVSTELLYLQYRHGRMKRKIAQTNFPFGQRASGKGRKRQFMPPQLSHIEREGKDWRHGRHVDETMWQKEFSFRGVQFGNWLSQKDRQASMDFCFDALKDLADILGIEDSDVAFSKSLGLAFGARGHGNARAHYEPLMKVINLTKMSGAGCTAHEWMHALDHQIALHYGRAGLASEELDDCYPESFRTLVRALSKDENGTPTDYYRGSRRFDSHFAKESHGHWTSPCEMLARAFACYVKDTLGCKSDYLIAHADAYRFEFDNQGYSAVPQDEEREYFNSLFDDLFVELKKEGILHRRTYAAVEAQPDYKIVAGEGSAESVAEPVASYDLLLRESEGGQMRFVFA